MPHFRRLTPLVAVLLLAPAVRGQDELRRQGLTPAGARTTLTESWGVLEFIVVNPGATPRDSRVLALFPEDRAVQYGRDVWVPAHTALTTWLPIGPAPKQPTATGRELEYLLYDRTAGTDRLILPPADGERVRSRAVVYRSPEPSTAVLLDYPSDDADPEHPNRPGSRAAEAMAFVRTVRVTAGLSEHASSVPAGPLPPIAEAFAGIDHLVVAGNRLAADPAGTQAVRQWVRQGGRLWVMLDLVDPTVAAPFLADELPFEVVDRASLTTVRLTRPPARATDREFDRPVDLVRVLPGPADQVLSSVDGWPAAFARTVGRGRVVFTTLGPAGWPRPLAARDRPGPTARPDPKAPRPASTGSLAPLEDLAGEVMGRPKPHPFTTEDLRPLLTEEIGYAVPGRPTAALILGVFLVALIGLGVGLRRSRRAERIGWLAPAAALGAGAVFLVMAETSRRAVPPTVATAAVADVVPGSDEAALHGLFAVYQPDSGPVPVASAAGATLDLDVEGLEGQARRRIQTDTDAWHYEGLGLPAGVRTGPFQATVQTGRVSAVARFGPDGVEGTLTAAAFRDPADGLILAPAREPIALRLGPDGRFTAGLADVLPAGQFLAGAVLTDRQQRRQAVYRKLLSEALPRHLEGRDLLFAWAEPAAVPFAGREGARAVGTALVVVALEFERPAGGTRVTIPSAFLPYRRWLEGRLQQPTLESSYPVEMELRFQLPPSVQPLTVERATLTVRARGPSRRVTVGGLADGRPVTLTEVDNPVEPLRVEITDQRLLRPDDQGGMHLTVSVTNIGDGPFDTAWRIEAIGLEVVGRTGQ